MLETPKTKENYRERYLEALDLVKDTTTFYGDSRSEIYMAMLEHSIMNVIGNCGHEAGLKLIEIEVNEAVRFHKENDSGVEGGF